MYQQHLPQEQERTTSGLEVDYMVDSKKYDGSQWEHSLRKMTTATEAVENPLYSDGTAITAYTLKGNTVQSGTPTPSNPVEVNGVGERTENLYNNTYYIQNANRNHCTVETLTTGFKLISNGGDTYLGSAGKSPDTASSTAINSSIEVKPETKYTLHLSSSPWCFVSYIGTDGTYLNSSYINIPQRYVPIDYTFTTPANCKYVLFRLGSGVVESGDETSITDIMLVEGETAPTSYIPYGYKIPISSGQTVLNPMYFSQQLYKIGDTTDSFISSGTATYAVRKYEITGQENIEWKKSTAYLGGFYTSWRNSFNGIDNTQFYCSHAQYVASLDNYQQGTCYSDGSCNIRIMPDSSTVQDWIDYLTTQYANGTPVTIVYKLITPTTETVTAPSIPTTEGANTITVETTVQPSEFTATWTGWHDSSVKEYDGTDWQ